MKSYFLAIILICSLGISVAHADATLVYALTDSSAGTVNKKISLSRFFARVDSSDRPHEFLLFQAGKFFPLYRVNTADATYALLSSSTGQKGASEPDSAASKQKAVSGSPHQPADTIIFKPTRKMEGVAGVKCRLVLELEDQTPGIEHCMANKAGLGLTERESRTLARLFVLARKLSYGWLGAATPDEDFVSVRSKLPDQAGTLELLSVSTAPLQRGYLKVPSEFKEIEASSSQ